MAFEDSVELIKIIEQRVLDFQKRDVAIIDYLNRQLIYPFKILLQGYKLIGNDFLKFSLITLFSLFSVLMLIRSVPSSLFNLIFNIVMLIPIVISLFPTPSVYCNYKVDANLVNFTKSTLSNMNIETEKTIQAIESNINQFELRVKSRITFLKGSIYVGWAFVLYFLNVAIEHSSQINLINLLEYIYCFLGLSIFYTLILCYEKVNDIIFKTAIFGCVEYRITLR